MDWTIIIARFIAGFLIGNGLPHLINGISGRRFPTPFAKPPAVGLSSPVTNVLWAAVNLAVGYWLLFGVGEFTGGFSNQMLSFGLGLFLVSIALAWHFERVS